MRVSRMVHVLDARDLHAESSFWAGLLDGTVDADDDWHSVIVDGDWRLGIQLAPNQIREGRLAMTCVSSPLDPYDVLLPPSSGLVWRGWEQRLKRRLSGEDRPPGQQRHTDEDRQGDANAEAHPQSIAAVGG
jgi:hypothetical protein